jgi:hypothetical protein
LTKVGAQAKTTERERNEKQNSYDVHNFSP